MLPFFFRKPFHPKRLNELWLAPFFADPIELEEDEEEIGDITEEEKVKLGKSTF